MLLPLKCLINGNAKKRKPMLDKETRKEENRLKKELDFYLDFYKEIAGRGDLSAKTLAHFNEQIDIIIERLKEIGR